MEEFYPQIRTVHIWAVTASGLLFALRGGAFNLLGATWPRAMPARLLSWTIDRKWRARNDSNVRPSDS